MNTRKIKASKDAYLLGMSLPIYFWTKGFGRLTKLFDAFNVNFPHFFPIVNLKKISLNQT